MSEECRVCGKTFKNERGLHLHIPKAHKIPLAEYYVNIYERRDKLTNELLEFNNKEDYFNIDFASQDNLRKWALSADKEEVKDYLLIIKKYTTDFCKEAFMSQSNILIPFWWTAQNSNLESPGS